MASDFMIPNQGPVPENEYANYWNRILKSDPQMMELLGQARGMGGGEKEKEAIAADREKQLGLKLPDNNDWSLDYDKNGYRVEKKNFLNRNKNWIIPAAVGVGTLGLGAASVGPLSGMFGGGAGAGAGETGATLGLEGSGFAGSAGGIGSTALGTAGADVAIQGPSLGTLGAGGSKLGALGKIFGKGVGDNDTLADIGKVAGDFGEAETLNRYRKADMTQNYDQLMLRAQDARNNNESDAMKKLAQTSYMAGGGNAYQPPKLNSGTAGSFGIGPKASSAAQQQAANTLQGQLLTRMAPGGSYSPTDLDSYANRGTEEKIGKYAGLGGTIGGVIRNLF